jgi:Protein of unknown function (DUF1493)
MDHRTEVQRWLDGYLGRVAKAVDADDVLGSLRYAGDDADDLIYGFAAQFKVDMATFSPWHHYDADEPPIYRRYQPYSAEGKELPDLPIAVSDLAAAAASGRWMIEYSDRQLRYNSPIGRHLRYVAVVIAILLIIALVI